MYSVLLLNTVLCIVAVYVARCTLPCIATNQLITLGVNYIPFNYRTWQGRMTGRARTHTNAAD